MRPLVYVHKDKIVFSNSRVSAKKINNIVKNFDESKVNPVTGLLTQNDGGTKFVLTDGNHTTKALIAKGYVWIPAILLTQEEFDHVAYSKNTVDIKYAVPEKKIFI